MSVELRQITTEVKQNMSNEWYIERQGGTAGPFSGAQLKELAASGRLRTDDRVRRGHDGKAALAGKVQGLFVSDTVQRSVAPSGSGPSSPLPQHVPVASEPPPLPVPSTPPPNPLNRRFPYDRLLQRAANAASALKGATVDASRLAVLEAERTKLRMLTLPRAYAALGAFVLSDKPQAAADFPGLVERIRERGELLAKLSPSERVEEEPQGLSGRARGVVAKLTDAASQKVHASQQKDDLAELGRSALERYGDEAGPVDLLTSIRQLRGRLDEIDTDLRTLEGKAAGRILTPRRMALAGAVGCAVLFIGVLSNSLGIGGKGFDGNSSTASGGFATGNSSSSSPVSSSGDRKLDLHNGSGLDGTSSAVSPLNESKIDGEVVFVRHIKSPICVLPAKVAKGRGYSGLSLSSDGKLLLSHNSSNDELWSTETREQIPLTPVIRSGRISPDGRLLAGISNESILGVARGSHSKLELVTFQIDGEQVMLRDSIPFELGRDRHSFGALSVNWSPDSRCVVLVPVNGSEGTEWFWATNDASKGQNAWASFEDVIKKGIRPQSVVAHAEIIDLKGRPATTRLVAEPRRMDGDSPADVRRHVEFTPSEGLLVLQIGSAECFYDLPTGRLRHSSNGEDNDPGSQPGLVLPNSPGAKYRIVSNYPTRPPYRTTVEVWKVTPPSKIFTYTAEHEGSLDLVISHDDTRLAIGEPAAGSGERRVFSLPDGEHLFDEPYLAASNWYPNGVRKGWSLVPFPRGPVEVWSAEGAWPVAILGTSDGNERNCSAISSDGKVIATAYRGSEGIEIWKFGDDKPVPLTQFRRQHMEKLPERPVMQYFTLTEAEQREGWTLPMGNRDIAPKVSLRAFQQLRRGMSKEDVESVLGGAPHKSLMKYSRHSQGTTAQRAAFIFDDINVYAGESPDSVVVLRFRKDEHYARPTLVEFRQRGLK